MEQYSAEVDPLRSSSSSASTPPTAMISDCRPASDKVASTVAACSRQSVEHSIVCTHAATALGSDVTLLSDSATCATLNMVCMARALHTRSVSSSTSCDTSSGTMPASAAAGAPPRTDVSCTSAAAASSRSSSAPSRNTDTSGCTAPAPTSDGSAEASLARPHNIRVAIA